MIIRVFLALFFAALIVLIIADVFYELQLGGLATLILKLGDDILFMSFALFLITGIVLFIKHSAKSLKNYFSASERAQRRAFFSMAQHRYLERLFASKKQQLLYFANLKRQALLRKNNKKQTALLAKAMLKELQFHKARFSEIDFKHYQQAIKHAAAHHQMPRLLELQQEISTLASK